MPPQPQDLMVRAHERRECDVPASVHVGEEDARRVTLTGAATGNDGGVPCRLVDYSEGGAGVRSGVFLPVGCAVTVEVGGDSGGEGEPVRLRGVVRRAQMVDRAPSYYLGIAFSEPMGEALARLRRAAGAVRREGAA